ncbi:hypothetical protein S7335_1217 [Synechococcus sp. PCC 7335]|uniref:hypothetical protein n=1 Tax=Synechococcus sp. (strain ATCC 29403 / PCC 7335) TaxID=91464 RepID=UPI00017EB916|nr:hypothetical protein [Synechococcus sp. PCC 7335]EDX82513.1 hypothetical protein S7335_1217 [Synechococcus sp. PCC 7335]
MADKDEDFLVELVELSAASNKPILPPANPNESEYRQRCEAATRQLKPKLREAATDGRYDSVALMPLHTSEIKKNNPLRRPLNTDVESEIFQDFVWDLVDKGLRCFIDRPGLSSALFALESDGYEKPDVEWDGDHILYVLLPGHEPPRRFWARTLVFYAKPAVRRLLAFTAAFSPPVSLTGFFFILSVVLFILSIYLWIQTQNIIFAMTALTYLINMFIWGRSPQ